MGTVVITGAAGVVGRTLTARLGEDSTVAPVPPADPQLARRLRDADALVHLGGPDGLDDVLRAAGDAGVDQVVYLSTATVYGAWSDNAVPLSEDTPLRPNPGFEFGVGHAEAERLLAEWSDDHPTAAVTVLRPAMILADEAESRLARTLGRPPLFRSRDAGPIQQFLHVDDLAEAAAHALQARLNATCNVAPDGWLSAETARHLATTGPTLPLPDLLARPALALAHRLRLTELSPDAVPYAEHPWVVANDRLKESGWRPRHSSEQAVVGARKASWYRELSPKRRQEVSLGAAGVLTALIVALVVYSAGRGGRAAARAAAAATTST